MPREEFTMRLVPIALMLALAACNSQPAAEPTAPGDTASTSEAPIEAAPTGSATISAKADELPEVTLTSTGLILVGAVEGRGTATTLEFGRDRQAVLDVMAVDFPKPTLSAIDECGAGPMTFAEYGALKLNFLDGKFVGWFADPADNLVTSDGIRPGIPLADLKAERQVTMADSTLDGEFDYASPDGGDIAGFVDKQGKIMSLNAGMNCFFR